MSINSVLAISHPELLLREITLVLSAVVIIRYNFHMGKLASSNEVVYVGKVVGNHLVPVMYVFTQPSITG